jgi:hypothetical protein
LRQLANGCVRPPSVCALCDRKRIAPVSIEGPGCSLPGQISHAADSTVPFTRGTFRATGWSVPGLAASAAVRRVWRTMKNNPVRHTTPAGTPGIGPADESITAGQFAQQFLHGIKNRASPFYPALTAMKQGTGGTPDSHALPRTALPRSPIPSKPPSIPANILIIKSSNNHLTIFFNN